MDEHGTSPLATNDADKLLWEGKRGKNIHVLQKACTCFLLIQKGNSFLELGM